MVGIRLAQIPEKMLQTPDQGPAGSPLPVGAAQRRPTRPAIVRWGSHAGQVGGNAPVVVQSMPNTRPAAALATAVQLKELALAGSALVRITVNTPEAAQGVRTSVVRGTDRT